MKVFLKGLIFMAVLTAGTLLEAAKNQEKDAPFGKIRIYCSSRSAPDAADVVTSVFTGSFRNKWQVFTIDFVPRFQSKKEGQWADGVTLQLLAAGVSRSSRSGYVLLSGSSRFFAIAYDGKKHTAVMMIPPQILDRYFPSGTVSLTVQASFADPSGKILGRGYFLGKSVSTERSAAALFDRIMRDSGSVIVTDGVWPISQTPWRDFRPDRQDLLMPEIKK